MKVGDLVKLRPHCRNRDRLAIVIGTTPIKEVIIQYINDFEDVGPSIALISNLELVSEA